MRSRATLAAFVGLVPGLLLLGAYAGSGPSARRGAAPASETGSMFGPNAGPAPAQGAAGTAPGSAAPASPSPSAASAGEPSTNPPAAQAPAPGAAASSPAPAALAPTPPAAPIARSDATLPTPLPGVRRDVSDLVGGALRAAAGDVDGDGSVDLVFVDAANLRIVPSSKRNIPDIPVDGAIQVLSVVDLDGDGRDDILAGWGATTQDVRVQACVNWFHVSGDTLSKETVALPSSKRPEIVAILPFSPTSILYAFYDEKYMVEGDVATRETAPAWTSKYFAEIRMADAWARADVDGDGKPDLVVGQLYGESGSSAGGAFIFREDHSRVPIPTTRGVRALVIADTDGDGKNEVFLADGWNKDYVGKAQGLLSWSRWDGHAFRTEVIEETAQPSIQKILAVDLDGDGRPEIVTLGPKLVRAFKRTATGWRGLTIAGKARDIAAAKLGGKPGSELLIVASHSEIVDLRGVRWP